ncbi:fluoride efflux transporter CrcB [Leptospira sp. 'Mane']|uniref:fluoride efflux transporter CrcB n=1 Tax=Leptospira sp. 'Mane' TaxID=3387407 RepID=UPI00398B362E
MFKDILFIGLGGFAGTIGRYALSTMINQQMKSFLLGTFAVNAIGSLLIGIIYGLGESRDWMNPQTRTLLASGFCGGFTTFSAFAFENVRLIESNSFLGSIAYMIASVSVCILVGYIGYQLTK